MWGSALWGAPGQCTRTLHRWRDSRQEGPRNGHSQRRLKQERNENQSLVSGVITSALTWHGRVAGQEQRPTLLEDPCEPIADRVHAEVWPIIADTDHDGRLTSLG